MGSVGSKLQLKNHLVIVKADEEHSILESAYFYGQLITNLILLKRNFVYHVTKHD